MSELIVENLRKSYKTRTVVHDISLRINSGEIVGLLGPNGAGKTTSFYMMVGLVALDAGSMVRMSADYLFIAARKSVCLICLKNRLFSAN